MERKGKKINSFLKHDLVVVVGGEWFFEIALVGGSHYEVGFLVRLPNLR